MDLNPIKAAPSELERSLKFASEARYQIECEDPHRSDLGGGFEAPELALPGILNGIEDEDRGRAVSKICRQAEKTGAAPQYKVLAPRSGTSRALGL